MRPCRGSARCSRPATSRKHFTSAARSCPAQRRTVHAVDDVSLEVWPGETLGLVGESGCGKSTLGRCLVRLYDITRGTLEFEGRDITSLASAQLRPCAAGCRWCSRTPTPRSTRAGASATSSPSRCACMARQSAPRSRPRLRELMRLVELLPDHARPLPARVLRRPAPAHRHRPGAGAGAAADRRRRAGLGARRLDPGADHQPASPTCSERLGLTYVFIAHDLCVVRQVSTRIAVMYLGSIVETGPTELFAAPRIPTPQALISAVPVPSVDRRAPAAHRAQGRSCRARWTRRPAAASIPAAASPPRSAAWSARAAERRRGRLVACHHPLGG